MVDKLLTNGLDYVGAEDINDSKVMEVSKL
jgi:hypothetical protein